MHTDLADRVVREIRKRIAGEDVSDQSGPPVALPAPPNIHEPIIEDSQRFGELDTQIESAVRNIGAKPPVPPTWRGRLGSWIINIIRRALWWYSAAIQETLGLVNRRNREQAARHLELQKHIVALCDAFGDAVHRIEKLETLPQHIAAWRKENRAAQEQLQWQFGELERSHRAVDLQLTRLLPEVTKVQLELNNLIRYLEEHGTTDIQIHQHLQEQIDQLKTTVRELRVSNADTDSRMAPLYADFQDLFRGARDLIKQRLEVYLPFLEQAKVGCADSPILDLGCGRGEWLQLLSEHTLSGRGVDSNPIMVDRCKTLGLDVSRADALTYLRSLPDQSLGTITSFHMVEHLPFETVLAIVGEAFRTLKPGGLLILETPNPHNLLVGSQGFWIDPTHRHPIVSHVLRFFVEACGFRQVEILDLQPCPEDERLPEDSTAGQWINRYFYGPRDYSVLGRRL